MGKRVWVVDDQPGMRRLLTGFLSQQFNVTPLESALSAMESLEKGDRPDLIIMDMMMPGMTGLEFLREAGIKNENLPPIMMLSGIENSTERIKCLSNGAKDYITKPFNPEELKARIGNLIS